MMTVAGNLPGMIAMGRQSLQVGLLAAPYGGAIHREADEGAVVKGPCDVSLGARRPAKAARVGAAGKRSVK